MLLKILEFLVVGGKNWFKNKRLPEFEKMYACQGTGLRYFHAHITPAKIYATQFL